MNLSIIIPTFNRVEFLKDTLQSIISQTPSVYEIIVVDDGSKDDTIAFCEVFKKEHTNVKFIVHKNKNNKGAQFSRNKGLSLSTGSLVMFLDSDDTLYKNNLSILLATLSKTQKLDYVYGQVIKTNANLEPLDSYSPIGNQWDGSPQGVAGYHWSIMGAVYKKDYLQKVGDWDCELIGSQDWEFQARVKLAGGKGEFLPIIIANWRDHEEQRIGAKSFRYNYVKSVIIACRKIVVNAKVHQQFNQKLAKKLARKILFHALEFSVNGYKKERNLALDEACEILGQNRDTFYFMLKMLKKSPSYIDKLIWQLINRK